MLTKKLSTRRCSELAWPDHVSSKCFRNVKTYLLWLWRRSRRVGEGGLGGGGTETSAEKPILRAN